MVNEEHHKTLIEQFNLCSLHEYVWLILSVYYNASQTLSNKCHNLKFKPLNNKWCNDEDDPSEQKHREVEPIIISCLNIFNQQT